MLGQKFFCFIVLVVNFCRLILLQTNFLWLLVGNKKSSMWVLEGKVLKIVTV